MFGRKKKDVSELVREAMELERLKAQIKKEVDTQTPEGRRAGIKSGKKKENILSEGDKRRQAFVEWLKNDCRNGCSLCEDCRESLGKIVDG